MGANNETKTKLNLRDGKLLGGMQKNQATLPPSWTLLGSVYTIVQLIAILQRRLSKVAAADVARAAWEAALKAAAEEIVGTKPVIDAARKQLLLSYGNAPDTLAQYGLSVPKRARVKPTTRVVAAAKAKATREARHTMGSKKRKSVKGQMLEAVAIATATKEVTPEPAPAAAAPAPGASARGAGDR